MDSLPPTDIYLKRLAAIFDQAVKDAEEYYDKEDTPEGIQKIEISVTLTKKLSAELKQLCNRFI